MAVVQILPGIVVDQIAAGEIIERPASVVKELLENAIDAGATQIIVEAENGGRTLQVTDNGRGMAKEDLETAIMRFATSKIHDAEDLNHIDTYGFRGEALPSIGSVARMRLTSNDGQNAHSLQVDGGKRGPPEAAVLARGTQIQVRDLFFNVPARLKFLKTPQTENRKISQWMQAFALARPECSMKLIADGRVLFDQSARPSLKERVLEMYGEDVFKHLCVLDASFGSGKISGMVSSPQHTRRDRSGIRTFVNGRLVQARILNYVVNQFYRDKIPHGVFPTVILLIDIDPGAVDVNVHPAKLEVRFRREGEVIAACLKAFGMALQGSLDSSLRQTAPPVFGAPPPFSGRAFQSPEYHGGSPVSREGIPTSFASSNSLESGESSVVAESSAVTEQDWIAGTQVRLVGQLKDSYLLLEQQDALLILDQHAAHERVLYEAMLLDLEKRETLSQPLLIPQVLPLLPEDFAYLEELIPQMNKLGFQIQAFGQNTLKIDALPVHVKISNMQKYLDGLLTFLKDKRREDPGMDKLVRGVCRQSVMFGDSLSTPEQESLVQQLFLCQNPYSCPHGRPTFFRMPWAEINRKLGRE